MYQTFYQFLMTQRNHLAYDEISNFAQNAFLDQAFPKQATDYHQISEYLELNAGYLPSMDIFDTVWQRYTESEG
ncbi:YozE family protein [Periweissella fabaria]|uniref:UPF0346 protein WFA24289_00088 n=1 Tax=Periweissella fabaria TaxID=546157 RepID=A0ABM8Z4N2_9LACO|nr:YozE family protein [Periweissella fabaria]MCM0596481.1 YozE family protein [Periweissella fabaria]CAH0415790.1 hypothetical protein WFA24289_00088 [Periweissella fabaria]